MKRSFGRRVAEQFSEHCRLVRVGDL